MTEEIKECPVCKSNDVTVATRTTDIYKHVEYICYCRQCKLGTQGSKTRNLAIQSWNDQPPC